jgi:hypothetical protein
MKWSVLGLLLWLGLLCPPKAQAITARHGHLFRDCFCNENITINDNSGIVIIIKDLDGDFRDNLKDFAGGTSGFVYQPFPGGSTAVTFDGSTTHVAWMAAPGTSLPAGTYHVGFATDGFNPQTGPVIENPGEFQMSYGTLGGGGATHIVPTLNHEVANDLGNPANNAVAVVQATEAGVPNAPTVTQWIAFQEVPFADGTFDLTLENNSNTSVELANAKYMQAAIGAFSLFDLGDPNVSGGTLPVDDPRWISLGIPDGTVLGPGESRTFTIRSNPEPSSIVFVLVGGLGLLGCARLRKRQA